MEVLFAFFEIMGTVSFAISGAMEGIRHKMDLFGVMMLGLVTCTGGGILRDIVIGVTPPRIFQHPTCAIIALVVSLAVFIVLRTTSSQLHTAKSLETLYAAADTLGLGVFTVLGIQSAGSGNTGLMLFVGVITGVGGGVLRDVLAGIVPSIFRKHIYALASLAGALVDILLMRALSPEIAMVAGFGTVVLIRMLAIKFRWNLPRID